jgi:hypothetical protein
VKLSMGGGHGQSWSSMGRPWGLVGEEGEGGEGEGAGSAPGGHSWGRHGGALGGRARPAAVFVHATAGCFGVERAGREEGEKEEREKKKERKEKKRKNMKKFPNLKIFGEKNKRQFMKLVKIIFVQERNNPNYN